MCHFLHMKIMCLPGNMTPKRVKLEETEGKTTKMKAPLVVLSFCLREESDHMRLVETPPPGRPPVCRGGSRSVRPQSDMVDPAAGRVGKLSALRI